MATFAIAFDGTRVSDASTTTGWTADSATPTLEVDFFYQGTTSISGTVKTSEIGFYFTSSSQNLSTGVGGVGILKILATNKDVLDGNGFIIRIGSGTGAYYQYNSIFTATTYPIAGGWQVVGINPNVSQWRSSTTGSPNLAAVIYWAFRADFSATSKSQNVASDAIDWITLGTGLTCTRGDSTDPDGTFALILAADEGTAANRWGIIQSRAGILFVNGVITIGASGTATSFTDSNQVLVFPHHRVTNGFCGIDFNIQNASTVISATACFFTGAGALSSSDDTRPDHTVVGTSGTLTVSSSVFSVFRQIDWNNKVTALNCSYVNGLKIVGDGANMSGSKFAGCTGAADISYLFWNVATDPDGLLDDCTFTKGSTATHAIEFGTSSPTTMTLRGVIFSGYNGSNNQNDSAIYVKRTTGTVTINIVGGTSPSYRTDGAVVDIVADPVTVSVTAIDAATQTAIQNVRVLVLAAASGPMPFDVTVTISRSGATATVAHTGHGMATNDKVQIKGANQLEYNGVFSITFIDANSYSYAVAGTPATPATGTIKATYAAISGLTDVNGFISTTRTFASDQPISGRARKSSASPLYKTGPLSGTIDNTSGLAMTVQLVRDD